MTLGAVRRWWGQLDWATGVALRVAGAGAEGFDDARPGCPTVEQAPAGSVFI